jgi:hypothetical protein
MDNLQVVSDNDLAKGSDIEFLGGTYLWLYCYGWLCFQPAAIEVQV